MKLLMLCSSSTIKTLSLIFIAVYLLLNFFIQRQLHGEPCAALRPIFASDAAAMGPHHRPANGQADAHAAAPISLLTLQGAVKEMLQPGPGRCPVRRPPR